MEQQEQYDYDEMDQALEKMRLLNVSNGKLQRNLSWVCGKLSLTEDSVVGLYLYGSRLWGTAHESSDYDFLVVLKRRDPAAASRHVGNIDVLELSVDEFKKRLDQHAFLCVMTALWLPEDWVWKRAVFLERGFKFDFRLDLFERAVLDEVERDWDTAAKRRRKDLKDAAQKIEMHAIRMLRILHQIKCLHRNPPHLCCAVDVFQILQNDYTRDGSVGAQYLQEEKCRLLKEISRAILIE